MNLLDLFERWHRQSMRLANGMITKQDCDEWRYRVHLVDEIKRGIRGDQLEGEVAHDVPQLLPRRWPGTSFSCCGCIRARIFAAL